MEYPKFFDDVETIVLRDELAEFLGVNTNGLIEFSYLDVVKVSGHSCAVVAGGYLMALTGLKYLYPEQIPERGKIIVEIKKSPDEDNMGVIGCVLSSITGATTDYGFGGLPDGRFNRRNLLFYKSPIKTDVRLKRVDTGKCVGINYRPAKVVNPESILMSVLKPDATDKDRALFPYRFQEMVETILKNPDKVIELVPQ